VTGHNHPASTRVFGVLEQLLEDREARGIPLPQNLLQAKNVAFR
jgi:hypothetical protein